MEKLFDAMKLPKLVIISFILITITFDSRLRNKEKLEASQLRVNWKHQSQVLRVKQSQQSIMLITLYGNAQSFNLVTSWITLYILTSVLIFSILFLIQFLWYFQGEFVSQSQALLVYHYFPYSHDLSDWFSSHAVRRIWSQSVSLRGYRVDSSIQTKYCYFQSINSLNPKSDQHLISPNHITPESHIKVMRIKEMITNQRSFWLVNKFSLSAP